MKNNWVRLIAGVLVSVALVGAISLTGGMKKGSRTDGLLYEASGLHPDGQLLLVNGKAVTCEEYLYWLAYDCEYLSTYVQDIDWSTELTSGVTYGDYAQTDTLETVKLYSVVRAWAEEAGITLTDEDQEAKSPVVSTNIALWRRIFSLHKEKYAPQRALERRHISWRWVWCGR